MLKAIIFDFDGTVADTEEILFNGIKKIAQMYGLKDINLNDFKNKSAKQIIQKDYKIKFYQLRRFMKEVGKEINDRMLKARLFKGMKEVCEKLSKKYIVGFVTSNKEERVKHILENAGIKKIDFVFSEKSCLGKNKSIKKAIKKFRLKKEEVIYVGDEVRDIEAARKAGVKIIAVSYGFNTKEILIKNRPDFLAEKPEDILRIL